MRTAEECQQFVEPENRLLRRAFLSKDVQIIKNGGMKISLHFSKFTEWIKKKKGKQEVIFFLTFHSARFIRFSIRLLFHFHRLARRSQTIKTLRAEKCSNF